MVRLSFEGIRESLVRAVTSTPTFGVKHCTVSTKAKSQLVSTCKRPRSFPEYRIFQSPISLSMLTEFCHWVTLFPCKLFLIQRLEMVLRD